MPRISVFACPACGASLSVDNEHDTLIKCQFCSTTVIVPEELRPQRHRAGVNPTQAEVVVPANVDASNLPGLGSIMSQADKLRQLGNLVRAGNKLEAVRIYQETFGGSLADAQAGVDALAAGMPVQVSSASFGTPISAHAAAQAPAQPYVVTPAQVTVSGTRGGSLSCAIIGLVLTITLASLLVGVFATGLVSFGAILSFLPGASSLPGGFARQVLSFGGQGTGIGVFTDARHIAVDAEGNIYVGEYQNPRIQKFDSSGEFITQWQVGDRSTILMAIAVSRDGVVYAVHESMIHLYDGSTGELLQTLDYDGGWGFEDIAMAPDGGFVASWYKNRDDIVRFDRNGSVVIYLPEAISGVTGRSELSTNVAIDGQGAIYALGHFNNAVFRYSADGRYLNMFGGSGDSPGQFRAPAALAVDNQSRVYVSDFKGIQVFDADGRYLDIFDPPGHTFGLAFDDNSALYTISNDGVVRKYLISDP
jgi:hypothetical protein